MEGEASPSSSEASPGQGLPCVTRNPPLEGEEPAPSRGASLHNPVDPPVPWSRTFCRSGVLSSQQPRRARVLWSREARGARGTVQPELYGARSSVEPGACGAGGPFEPGVLGSPLSRGAGSAVEAVALLSLESCRAGGLWSRRPGRAGSSVESAARSSRQPGGARNWDGGSSNSSYRDQTRPPIPDPDPIAVVAVAWLSNSSHGRFT